MDPMVMKILDTEPDGVLVELAGEQKFLETGVPQSWPGANRIFFRVVRSAHSGAEIEYGAVAAKQFKLNVVRGDSVTFNDPKYGL